MATPRARFLLLCVSLKLPPHLPPPSSRQGHNKTYYHVKDIAYLLHEPLLKKARELAAYDKKVRGAGAAAAACSWAPASMHGWLPGVPRPAHRLAQPRCCCVKSVLLQQACAGRTLTCGAAPSLVPLKPSEPRAG